MGKLVTILMSIMIFLIGVWAGVLISGINHTSEHYNLSACTVYKSKFNLRENYTWTEDLTQEQCVALRNKMGDN